MTGWVNCQKRCQWRKIVMSLSTYVDWNIEMQIFESIARCPYFCCCFLFDPPYCISVCFVFSPKNNTTRLENKNTMRLWMWKFVWDAYPPSWLCKVFLQLFRHWGMDVLFALSTCDPVRDTNEWWRIFLRNYNVIFRRKNDLVISNYKVVFH